MKTIGVVILSLWVGMMGVGYGMQSLVHLVSWGDANANGTYFPTPPPAWNPSSDLVGYSMGSISGPANCPPPYLRLSGTALTLVDTVNHRVQVRDYLTGVVQRSTQTTKFGPCRMATHGTQEVILYTGTSMVAGHENDYYYASVMNATGAITSTVPTASTFPTNQFLVITDLISQGGNLVGIGGDYSTDGKHHTYFRVATIDPATWHVGSVINPTRDTVTNRLVMIDATHAIVNYGACQFRQIDMTTGVIEHTWTIPTTGDWSGVVASGLGGIASSQLAYDNGSLYFLMCKSVGLQYALYLGALNVTSGAWTLYDTGKYGYPGDGLVVSSGTIIMAYYSLEYGDTDHHMIHVFTFKSPTTQLSAPTDSFGQHHVSYVQDGDIKYARTTVSTADDFANTVTVYTDGDKPSLVILPDGRLQIAFEDGSGTVLYRYSRDNGATWTVT